MIVELAMSASLNNFDVGIKDAEELLKHFDAINSNPPPDNAEVLKRAALVMAMTAWETYVEDRVVEETTRQLKVVSGSFIGNFVNQKLSQELKSFHNPNSERTKRLFQDYLSVDVTLGWNWTNMDSEKAKKSLNQLLSKRGDAVHRSKPATNGQSSPHLVKRDELDKAIRFIKELVKATDIYIALNV